MEATTVATGSGPAATVGDPRPADSERSRRPRLLVAVTYGLSVRYLMSAEVLERLADVADVVVALGWDDAALVEELDRRGLSTVRLPDARLDHDCRRLRRQLDLVHEHRLRSPTTSIERRRRDSMVQDRTLRALGRLRRVRDRVAVRWPGAAARLELEEGRVLAQSTNLAEFRTFVESMEVDLFVSVTPYHEQDTLMLHAADQAGVRSVISVISFDNPTTRRRFPILSERIFVWNEHNRAELLRSYPGLADDRVTIVGAPQFDLHHRPELILDDATWRSRAALPVDRPVILYGAGPSYLVPDEQRLVRLIDGAIDAGHLDGPAGRPVLLVRRHPTDDPRPWNDLAAELRHGRVSDPWEPGGDPNRGWPTTRDLEMQMSSLSSSAVHVNVCSSMTLDGAVFDRPQVGPTFVPGLDRAAARRVRDLYAREHWWPITESGGLATADSPAALVAALDDALRRPGSGRAGRRRMVDDLVGTAAGTASQRLASEILREATSACHDPTPGAVR